MYSNGSTLLVIIGEFVLMEMEQLAAVPKRSLEPAQMLLSVKVLSQPFQHLNHPSNPNHRCQRKYRMSMRMRLTMITTMIMKLRQVKTTISHRQYPTSMEHSLHCSRFFSSYLQLLQSMFTTITAIFSSN